MYNQTMLIWKKLINPSEIPVEYRRNFNHLYLDMGWFAILSGSSMAFLAIYAARLGANPLQIGFLGAMPAVVNLLFAIPASQWLQKRAIGKAVFWTSVFYRLGYMFMIILPWFFNDRQQIWVLILLSLLMGIPGTALAVGFNALFADAVPSQWRAHVAGIRNVVLSVVYVITSVVCGAILTMVPFPAGYQIVFGIGFLGAAMSSFHLFFVRSLVFSGPLDLEGINREPDGNRSNLGVCWFAQIRDMFLRDAIWKTPFRNTLLVLFFFHTAQYVTAPLFPIYFVNILHLTDQQIGLGTAGFYLTVFIGSTQFSRISNRFGHQKVTGVGVALMSLYPVLLSFSTGFGQYMLISLVGGFSWALVGGALANYLLEKIPAGNRPPYLAWYNIALNAAILLGSLLGPVAADLIGLGTALFIFGLFRLIAGLAILKWG
jgi:MFS family permease